MKNLKNYAWGVMMMAALASCSDDESSTGLSSAEQAEMVAASLGESGFSSSVEQSAVYANESLEAEEGKISACGYTVSEEVNVSNPAGTLITYSYGYEYDAVLVCSELVPQSITVTFSYSGEFDAPRLSSEHSGEGVLAVSSLDQASTSFTMNGSYDRTGAFASKVRNKNSGNSVVTLDVEDVMVNKTTYAIESGSAMATVTGTTAGKAFNFSATITFPGNGTATITINGTTYIHDLASGAISEQ